MTLIALTGKAGSGKDTVRTYLEKWHGYRGYAFADPMRNMVEALFEASGVVTNFMTDRQLKEQEIPQFGTSYRKIMQTLGTEWGRQQLHPDFWVRATAAKIVSDCSRSSRTNRVVISDLRFLNEAAWVKSCGGLIWRIDREVAPVSAHISESEMDSIKPDAVIMNTGHFDDLYRSIAVALQST